MDLNEQAGAAVDALLAEVGITLGDDAHRAAKMLWLDGFKAGMDATKKMHDDAFAAMRDSR